MGGGETSEIDGESKGVQIFCLTFLASLYTPHIKTSKYLPKPCSLIDTFPCTKYLRV